MRLSRLVSAVAIAALVMQCTIGAGPSPVPPTSLVATYGAADAIYAPVWIAQNAGFFSKRNLAVDLQYQASQIQIPSLLAGDVKLGLIGCSDVAAANASGADLLIIANLITVMPYLLMVPNSITKPSDLIGKTIAISKIGDTTDIMSRLALERLGIKPGAVTFVQVGSSANRVAALIGGAAQAGLVSPPITTDLAKRGFHTMLDIAKLRIPASLALTGRRDWINANRDTVQRYVAALMDGLAMEKRDKAYTIGQLKSYLKVDDPQALSDAYDYYSREVMATIPHATPEQCKQSVDALALTVDKLRNIDVSKFIDDSFVTAAARERRR